MLKLMIVAVLVGLNLAAVSEWDQCAGRDWTKECEADSVCVSADAWYAQCIPKTSLCAERFQSARGEINAWGQCGRGGVWKKDCIGPATCVALNNTLYQCQTYSYICGNYQIAAPIVSSPKPPAVADWAQCGGDYWQANCSSSAVCIAITPKYFRCIPYAYLCNYRHLDQALGVEEWGQCGKGGEWLKNCSGVASCVAINPWYFQCISNYQICMNAQQKLDRIQNQMKYEPSSTTLTTSTATTQTTYTTTSTTSMPATTTSATTTTPATSASSFKRVFSYTAPIQVIKLTQTSQESKKVAEEWEQCGANGWKMNCVPTAVCIAINQWFSQCVPFTKVCSEQNIIQNAEVPVWSQCGKAGEWKKECIGLASCVAIYPWHYQCQPNEVICYKHTTTTTTTSTTTTSTTTTSTTTASTTTTTTSTTSTSTTAESTTTTTMPTTTTATSTTTTTATTTFETSTQLTSTISFILVNANIIHPKSAKFPGCGFRYGKRYEDSQVDYSTFDFIATTLNTIKPECANSRWLDCTNFEPAFHGEMLKKAKDLNKAVVFYLNVIASEAKNLFDIEDCETRRFDENLCVIGAEFIRNNRLRIIERYDHQSANVAAYLDKETAAAVFLIETDFWQYYGYLSQQGGPISGAEMRKLFDDIVHVIKKNLPNALISWDVSPWLTEAQLKKWWGFFSDSQVDFVHVSGGQSHPELDTIAVRQLSWKLVSELTGKRIIADAGYSADGKFSNNLDKWYSELNVSRRVKDGVVAVTLAHAQKSPTYQPNICQSQS